MCIRDSINNCQQAIVHLTLAVESSNTELTCLWILMGQCCLLIHPIARDVIASSAFMVPNQLLSYAGEASVSCNDASPVDKLTILRLATKCYIRALQIQSKNASCWHNLAFSYHAQILEEGNSVPEGLNEKLRIDLSWYWWLQNAHIN